MKKKTNLERNSMDDDEMLPEYDFKGGVRGKYAAAIRERGYTVRVYNEDGTFTERLVPGSTVSTKASKTRWKADDAATIRDLVKHEAALINNRISWMTTLQGLLFAALGFAWREGRDVIYVLGCMGIAIAISTLASLRIASFAEERLLDQWDDNKPDDYNGPDVIGYRTDGKLLWYLQPWRLLPVLFVISWLTVMIINLKRS
jgi:hypothetical protein